MPDSFRFRLDPNFKRTVLALPQYLLRWLPIAVVAGGFAGCASALLIWSLNLATNLRESHLWLIALLPLAGLVEGLLYFYPGRDVAGGNNLIFEQIQQPSAILRFRMTPLILFTTFLTHLFGGSAGREGTALQTGASLADQLTRPFRLSESERRVLLMTGVSAGFGSVFGTPLAGAVFGMEVLAVGSVSYEAIFPCFVASLLGNLTTRLWVSHESAFNVGYVPALNLREFLLAALAGAIFGMEVLAVGSVSYEAIFPCFVASLLGNLTTRLWVSHESAFNVGYVPALNLREFLLAALAGAIFGVVALTFSWLAHHIELFFKRRFAWAPWRPLVGGVLVALAVLAVHTTRYIGLGIPTTLEAFAFHVRPWDWLLKLLFTALTLGSGFKGGEVTPLFFVGATLGNALSHLIALPTPLLAAMGFVGVFAGAANTPIASTLLAMELFGAEAGSFAAIACIFSYLFSGHSGIYRTQRIVVNKHGLITEAPPDTALHPEEAIAPQHDNVQL